MTRRNFIRTFLFRKNCVSIPSVNQCGCSDWLPVISNRTGNSNQFVRRLFPKASGHPVLKVEGCATKIKVTIYVCVRRADFVWSQEPVNIVFHSTARPHCCTPMTIRMFILLVLISTNPHLYRIRWRNRSP